MTWAAAALIVIGFMVLAHLLRIPARAAKAIQQSRGALSILRSAELDDLEKEKAIQAAAKQLIYLFVVITFAAVIALAVPVGVVWLGELAGIVNLEESLDRTLSWQVLLGATLLGGLMLFIPRKQGS